MMLVSKLLPGPSPLLCKTELTNTVLKIALFHTSLTHSQKVWNTWHKYKPNLVNMPLKTHVDFPEKYTVEPLKTKHLAGRDPLTGRVLTARLGGGVKHLYHWIDLKRIGPKVENEFYIEKVLQIITCGCRTAFVALVGGEDRLRYILATVNMKPGDLIKTSQYIPKNPVLPNEGDAHPLGALPPDTKVNCIEKFPGEGGKFVRAAGSSATVIRRINKRVILKMPNKMEVSFDENCMATVGQLSNPEHKDFVLGTPMKHRELGRRPKSGLFHKKTGRFGRKIRAPPPLKVIELDKPETVHNMRITFDHIPIIYHPKMFE